MKFEFSKSSMRNLKELHYILRRIAMEALSAGVIDFAIVDAYRDRQTQDKYFREGKSKVQFPNSTHNVYPAEAMDLQPYINGKYSVDPKDYFRLHDVIMTTAHFLGYDNLIEWGGNWKTFKDYPHFQLVDNYETIKGNA